MGSGCKDRWPVSDEIVRRTKEMLRSHTELSHNENDFQFHLLNKINNLDCFHIEMRIRSLSTVAAHERSQRWIPKK
jgi:hypothetical protein